jgi:hypothetical protein
MSKNPQPNHCSQGPSRTVLEQSVLQNCYRLFEPCLIDVSTLLSIVRTGLRTRKQVYVVHRFLFGPRNPRSRPFARPTWSPGKKVGRFGHGSRSSSHGLLDRPRKSCRIPGHRPPVVRPATSRVLRWGRCSIVAGSPLDHLWIGSGLAPRSPADRPHVVPMSPPRSSVSEADPSASERGVKAHQCALVRPCGARFRGRTLGIVEGIRREERRIAPPWRKPPRVAKDDQGRTIHALPSATQESDWNRATFFGHKIHTLVLIKHVRLLGKPLRCNAKRIEACAG